MLHGLHHLGLTVRDAERSADWYTSVLSLTQHRAGSPFGFDETCVGLDPDCIQLEIFYDPDVG